MDNELGKIALLIDADNFKQINKIKPAILEISKYGKISLKRAYANWTKDQFSNWGDVLRNFAIKPIHQIDYVSGKNATDMALTIDAMDFLYNSDYDVFVIVSGDSDFTPLAIKLKESGKTVIGISAKGNTSEAFVSSCDNFIYTENLENETQETSTPEDNKEDTKKDKNLELQDLIKKAYDSKNDEEYVNVSIAGSYIKRVKPDFDIRNYGVKKLTDYLKKYPKLYDVKNRKSGNKLIFTYKIKES